MLALVAGRVDHAAVREGRRGGHVNLVDPAGSLWHGSATLMLAAGSDTQRGDPAAGPDRMAHRVLAALHRPRADDDAAKRSDARPDHRRRDPARRDPCRRARLRCRRRCSPAWARRSIRSICKAMCGSHGPTGAASVSEAFGQLTVTLERCRVRGSRWSSRWVLTGWWFRRKAAVVDDRSVDAQRAVDAERSRHACASASTSFQRHGERRPRSARQPRGTAESAWTAKRTGYGRADLRTLRRRCTAGAR